MIDLLKAYGAVYRCDIAAFSVMGNHYHLVVRFQDFRELSQDELMEIALLLYPNSKEHLLLWRPHQWERFNQRIFDVSEFMRNVQAAFARWYNRTFERRGKFWADRFKSTLLEDGQAVVDCMLYVDLNPVRAGLVQRPEDHKGSSIHYRQIKKSRWLLPLQGLLGHISMPSAIREYRALLYHRGAVPSKVHHMRIPEELLNAEIARGFKTGGEYLTRLRFFVDGMALGSEAFIKEQLVRLRESGHYKRRKHPIKHLEGIHNSMKEQRGHAVVF